MDPSARNFVMQGQDTSSNRFGASPPTAPVDQQHSPCPALRAHNQLPSLHSQISGWSGPYYDPVHNSHSWWPQHSHHDAWQQHHHHHPATYVPPGSHHHFTHPSSSFTAPPGLVPPSGPSQMHDHPIPQFDPGYGGYFNSRSHHHQHTHSHPHTHMSTRSQTNFTPRPPPIPSLDNRMDAFGSHPANSELAWGPNRLPTLAHLSPTLPGYMTPRESLPSREPATAREAAGFRESTASTRVDSSSERPPTTLERHMWPNLSITTNQSATTNQTTNTVSMPPMPQSTGRLFFGARSTSQAFEAANSLGDSHSDDDSESTDTAMITSDVLDDISAVAGPRARIRAAQMMRRAGVPQCGRKVASKKAIASLISVAPEDLPEEERSCIICYNDYGVETPEGIIESPLRLPKCQHVFGDHCIKKWLAESDSCPYCRDKLPSEPPALHHRQEAVFQLMRQHASRHGESTDAGGVRSLGAHAYQHQDRRSPPIDNGEPRRRPRWRNRPSASSSRSNAPQSLTPLTGWALHYDTDPTRFGPSSHGQRHPTGPLGSPMAPRLPEGRNNQENNNPRFPGVHSFQSNEPGARLPFPNPLGATEMETAMGPSWASPRSGFLPYAVRNGPDNTVHQNGDNLPR